MTLSTMSEEPPEGRCWDPLGHRWVTPRFLYWYSRPLHSHLSGILHAPTAGIEPATCGLATQCGCSGKPRHLLTDAGFVTQLVPVSSGACYFTSPLTGKQAWNSGQVIEQSPYAGTVAPVGSTVDLQVCAGQPTISLG